MFPDLPPTVALRQARLAASAALPLGDLSSAERDRLAGFGSARRQRSFALGRSVLRRLLAERLGAAPEAVPLRVAEDGALELVGHPELAVSLAHTELRTDAGLVVEAVAVVAPHPVGVDLEALRPVRPDLPDRLLSDLDRAALAAFAPEEAALRVWVIKEAVLKAMRTGFRCSPRTLRLEPEAADWASVQGPEARRWRVRHARRGEALVAIAVPTR